MYAGQIGNLFIQKSKLVLRDEYGNEIDNESLVSDYGKAVVKTENGVGEPDWYVKGFFRKIDHNAKNQFIISEGGTHIILITGVPKSSPSLETFRYKGTLFTSYWEDTVKGALFQVLNIKPVYMGISKKLGLLQIK